MKVDPNTNPATRTITTEKWIGVDPNMVSAVMDKETGLLTLVNVQGATDTDENGNVVLSLNNALRSLVLIPTTVLSSSKGIVVDQMIYTRYKINNINKKNETLVADGYKAKVNGQEVTITTDTICPLTKVQYHVNPSNADINKVKDAMEFLLQDNVPFNADNRWTTRAKSSDDFAVAIKSDMTEFDSESGILTVYVDMKGVPATYVHYDQTGGYENSYVSMVALQVAKENGEFVTSDYGTLAQRKNLGLAIANQALYENHGEDYHFRSLLDGGTVRNISASQYDHASAKVSDQKVWETGNVPFANQVDTVIYYTRNAADGTLIAETLNVKDMVGLHMVASYSPSNCSDYNNLITWRSYPAYPVADDNNVIDAEDLGKVFPGWTLTYELVSNYKIGNNETDQAEYVKFDKNTGILSINTAYGSSAINRTPIIRVTLKDENGKVVNVAYIKVKIVERDGEPLEGLSLTMKNIDFKCTGNMVMNDYKEISKDVYDVVHMTKDEFHTQYPTFDARNNDALYGTPIYNADKKTGYIEKANNIPDNYEPTYPENIGYVEQVIETDGTQQTTHTLRWYFTAEELWENAGKTVSHVVAYTNGGSEIEIKLTTTITGLQKEFNITTARYISEYWTDGFEFAKFNVNVPPSVGYADDDKTLFENDMNSPFINWPVGNKSDGNLTDLDGYIRLLDSSDKDVKSVTSLEYKFDKSIEGEHTFNGVVYYFRVSQTGDSLLAAKKDAYGGNKPRKVEDVKWDAADVNNAATNKTHVIAIITNDIAAATPWPNGGRNKVELQETSAWAKAMLNSKELKVNLTVKGYVCDDEDKVVKITFDGKDYYTASYIRPLNEPAESNGNFIDGVDFGEAGSYLNVMDIVQLKDWRGRVFGMPSYVNAANEPVPAGDYWNYWLNDQAGNALGGYYGLESIELVSGNKCDLNGNKQDIPAAIQVNQTVTDPAPTAAKPAAPFGYITYKNNGTTVTGNYNLYLKFKVTYKWGEFITEEIKVPVAKTTVSPAPKF